MGGCSIWVLSHLLDTTDMMRRLSLYALMATHVSLASGTYVFSKAAAVGFPDPESLTLARALGDRAKSLRISDKKPT